MGSSILSHEACKLLEGVRKCDKIPRIYHFDKKQKNDVRKMVTKK